MPISASTGAATAEKPLNTLDGQSTGCVHAGDFAIVDNDDVAKQIRFSTSAVTSGTPVVLTAPAASGSLAVSGVSAIQYSAPLTGASVAIASTTRNLIVNPAGTIAELTLTLPAASDGKIFTVSSSQIVTTLTLTPDGEDTIKNDVTALTAGQAFTLVARSGVWYRG